MPLYEYECEDYGHRFERIQKFSDDLVSTCPSCGGGVKKLFSSPAIQFKGTGWYVTDYAKKTGASEAAESDAKGVEQKAKDSSSKDSTASTADSTSKTAPKAKSPSKGESSSTSK